MNTPDVKHLPLKIIHDLAALRRVCACGFTMSAAIHPAAQAV